MKPDIPAAEMRTETVESAGKQDGKENRETDRPEGNRPGRKAAKEMKPHRELTPKQMQQRKKLLVYPLMGLLFLGSMWLIFAPSDKKDESGETVGAFNADIPLPENDGIIGDKRKAYEQAGLEKKQADKVRSLQDFAFTADSDNTADGVELELPDGEPEREPFSGKSNVTAPQCPM